jgi:hypothetical protein
MTECSSTYEIFCYPLCRYSTHNTYISSEALDSLTDSKSIDDDTEHPHIVSCDAVKPTSLELYPSKDISSSYYDDYFEFFYFYQMDYFLCEKCEKFRINTISLVSLKCFSRKFEEYTFRCVVFFHR